MAYGEKPIVALSMVQTAVRGTARETFLLKSGIIYDFSNYVSAFYKLGLRPGQCAIFSVTKPGTTSIPPYITQKCCTKQSI